MHHSQPVDRLQSRGYLVERLAEVILVQFRVQHVEQCRLCVVFGHNVGVYGVPELLDEVYSVRTLISDKIFKKT